MAVTSEGSMVVGSTSFDRVLIRRSLSVMMSACLCAMPTPALSKAAASPTFTVDGLPGAISSLTIALPKGDRVVADRMIDTGTLVASEKAALLNSPAVRGSCAWASAVQPFTRLRGSAPGGRLMWAWDLAKQGIAMRLLGSGLPECISPDGRRLLVALYRHTREDLPIIDLLQGFAVISTVMPSGFVNQKPVAGLEPFGNPRNTAPIGWRPGCKATLQYEVDVRKETAARTVEGRFSGTPEC